MAARAASSRAHDGVHHEVPAIALSWTPNWWLLAGLLLSALLFVRGRRALAVRSSRRDRWNALAFWASWATLVVALVSPVDRWSDVFFSAHMSQHELLMLVAAPLFVLARPLSVYLWALPERVRQRVLSLIGKPAFRRSWRVLTLPWLALILHGLVRWSWHLPSLFEAALRDEWVHGFQHATFFATALLFWWSIVHGRYGRLGYGVSVLFVFLTAMHTGALGALIAFADEIWYPIHAQRTSQWTLQPLADQQTAGLIMWIGAGSILIFIGLALLAAWLGEAERRARRTMVASLTRTAPLSERSSS